MKLRPKDRSRVAHGVLLIGLSALVASCGAPTTSPPLESTHGEEETSASHGASAGAGHEDQKHESPKDSHGSDDHTPAAAPENQQRGPHGGVLVLWDEKKIEFEVVINRTDQSIAVYSRTADKKRAMALETKQLTVEIPVPSIHVQLSQVRQIGEPPDKSSLFKGTDPKLATSQQLSGTLQGQIEQAKLELKFHELAGVSNDF